VGLYDYKSLNIMTTSWDFLFSEPMIKIGIEKHRETGPAQPNQYIYNGSTTHCFQLQPRRPISTSV